MDNEWMEKLAIQELFARYAHAIDDLNPEAWVECFTPDGDFFRSARAPCVARRRYGAMPMFISKEIRCRHMMANFL